MTEIKNKIAPLRGGGVKPYYEYEEPSSDYTVYLTKDKTITGFLKEEYNYDGTYGPIPDEKGLVDLSKYAQNYISNYRNISEIPEENQKYLDSGLKASNMSVMFSSGHASNTVRFTNINISKIDTSNVTDMNTLFFNCNSLTSLDLSNFDTSQVTNMNSMFNACLSLTTLDLSNFDTSNVTDMMNMFRVCLSLTTLDLSNWDTSNVTDMYAMFYECNKLTTIIGSLDMSSCTNCDYMFLNCNSLRGVHLKNVPRSLDLSGIRGTEGVTYIIDNYID